MQENIEQTSVKKKKKHRLSSTLFLLIILCIPLFYLGVNLYMTYYRPYKLQTAIVVTLSDTIYTQGVIARTETVLPATTGIAVYTVDDGLRISSGATVAETYSGIVPALSKNKIDRIAAQIKSLQYVQNAGVVAGTDVDTVLRDMNDNYLKLLDCLTKETYYDYWDYSQGFTASLNRLQIATGQETDYNELIQNLSIEHDNLAVNAVANEIITAPTSGYFISSNDGYEQAFTPEIIKNYSCQDILAAKTNTSAVIDESVGKIISDYKWYYVCVVEKENAERFLNASLETKVEIKLSNSTSQSVPAFIEQVIEEENSDYVKIIIRCEVMYPEIANLRFENADVSFRTITGIRIDKKAMQIIDGQTGVFIKYGHLVSFKKITPIFENDEYILVPLNPNTEKTGVNEIKLFDEVIVEGKDLYNGKLL